MSGSGPRLATEADLPAIASLDAECFGNPWSLEVYRQELFRPFARLVVLEHDRELAGLACTWVLGDEAHLLRIVTAPARRRSGVGRRLLAWSVEQAAALGATAMLLEVAAANRPARRLYEGFHFQEIGRRRGYYKHPPDDAVVMRGELRPGDTSS